jgi:hypothetical protein
MSLSAKSLNSDSENLKSNLDKIIEQIRKGSKEEHTFLISNSAPGNYPIDRLNLIRNGNTNISNNNFQVQDYYMATYDIRGFTSFIDSIPISEDITNKQAIVLIESFFKSASNIIAESKGIMNKYVGDAAFCYWKPDNLNKDCSPIDAIYRIMNEFSKQLNLVDIKNRLNQHTFDLGLSATILHGKAFYGMFIDSPNYSDFGLIGREVNNCFRLSKKVMKNVFITSNISERNYFTNYITRELHNLKIKGVTKSFSCQWIIREKRVEEKSNNEYAQCDKYCSLFNKCKDMYEVGFDTIHKKNTNSIDNIHHFIKQLCIPNKCKFHISKPIDSCQNTLKCFYAYLSGFNSINRNFNLDKCFY